MACKLELNFYFTGMEKLYCIRQLNNFVPVDFYVLDVKRKKETLNVKETSAVKQQSIDFLMKKKMDRLNGWME